MRTSPTDLLIVGASTRAAAVSAVRSGFQPICVDRFGDVDLRRVAKVVAVDNDLHRTLDAVLALPPMPWIYTGSLENDPKFIAAVSQRHSLLGNPPSVLKKVRDPFWLEQTLQSHDLPALRVRPITDPPSVRTEWLLKPRHGGGGCRIAAWSGQRQPTREHCYLQEHRLGSPMSALFVASQTDVELIGVCEQLIGFASDAPTEFGYAGSIGPLDVPPRTQDWLQRLGDTLAHDSGLRGMFGIDFVLADEIPWLVEVNPRYTASVEVLERSLGRSLLAQHASTFERPNVCREQIRERPALPRFVGKQIVYATRDGTVPNLEQAFEPEGPAHDRPLIADIPAPGSRILTGWPVCTVFADADSVTECRARLDARRLVVSGCLDSQ